MPASRSNFLLWLVLGGGALLFFTVSLIAVALLFSGGPSSSFSLASGQIAVLDLEGIIFDSRDFNDQLKEYGNRSSIKAVVLRINSPGGGVAASQEIYEAVKKFRAETKKKVVVSMSSVAASGGYYIACAADKIFANPGSITGSIGVIAEWYNYGDLLKWAKLQSIVIKSGDLKDAGSPTRPLTDAEKAYFQGLINNMYDQFVGAVALGRKMNVQTVRHLADGRVYTGQEAKANGLIHEIGTSEDALSADTKMVGSSGEPRLLSPPKRKLSLIDLLFGDSRSVVALNPDPSESQIRFAYLWR